MGLRAITGAPADTRARNAKPTFMACHAYAYWDFEEARTTDASVGIVKLRSSGLTFGPSAGNPLALSCSRDWYAGLYH